MGVLWSDDCPTSYPMSVTVKTSVYLDEADKQRLAALAAATGTSEAELLRRGVRLVLEAAERPAPRIAVGASTDGLRARDVDEQLAVTGFGLP